MWLKDYPNKNYYNTDRNETRLIRTIKQFHRSREDGTTAEYRYIPSYRLFFILNFTKTLKGIQQIRSFLTTTIGSRMLLISAQISMFRIHFLQ